LKKLIGSLNFLIWLVLWFRMLEWGLDNHFKETTFLLPIMVLVPLIGLIVFGVGLTVYGVLMMLGLTS